MSDGHKDCVEADAIEQVNREIELYTKIEGPGQSLQPNPGHTHWRHARFTTPEPPWELREEPGRGWVAYATRDFAAGDLICVEFPTVWVRRSHSHLRLFPSQLM